MTPEAAAKLLQQDLDDPGSVDILDLNHAQALGIEALKEVQCERNSRGLFLFELLPGESRD